MNNKLKLTLVIDSISENVGGAEKVVTEIANKLCDLDYSVEICYFQLTEYPMQVELNNGIDAINLFPRSQKKSEKSDKVVFARKIKNFIKSLPDFYFLNSLKWKLTHGLFARQLEKHLKRNRPDLVIAFLPNAIVASSRAKATLGIPFIASIHNEPSKDFGDLERWDQNPIFIREKSKSLESADAITVLLKEFRPWFGSSIQKKVHVIPNMIEPFPIVEKSPDCSKIVVAAGRLEYVKNYSTLIAAWQLVTKAHSDWTLKIFGEGSERANLEAQIRDYRIEQSCKLLGNTSNLQYEISKSEIFVHPSHHEGFGLVIAEAFSVGVPVIGFESSAGVSQLIKDNINGILSPCNSHDETAAVELANGICTLISDASKRKDLSANALTSIQEFDPSIIMTKWDSLILKTLNQKADKIQKAD